MVSPCTGNGPASIVPGLGTATVMTSAGLAILFQKVRLPVVPQALEIVLAGVTWDLTELCSNNPPADPGLSADDLADALSFQDPARMLPALQRVYTWFKSWYWYVACECVSGGTPATPAPSNPGSGPSVNGGSPVGSVEACWDKTATFSENESGRTSGIDAHNEVLPGGVTTTFDTSAAIGFPYQGNTAHVVSFPPGGVQSPVMKVAVSPAIATGDNVQVVLNTFDADGTPHAWLSVNLTQTQTSGSDTFATPGGTPSYWALGVITSTTHSNTYTVTVELSFQCPGGTTIASSCCPPDPSLTGMLGQLLGLVTSIYQSLPSPLNSYASGTVHADLSGNGSVTLTDSPLAVLVNITTDPASLGSAAGDPTFLFDRGYLVPVINLGPIRQPSRLVYNPQVMLLPSLTEQIGYSLSPGVVISVTELTRGP